MTKSKVVYTRVSSKKQKDNLSLERQKLSILDSFNLDKDEIEILSEAKSAFSENNTSFLTNDEIREVYVYNIDRLTRNLGNFINCVNSRKTCLKIHTCEDEKKTYIVSPLQIVDFNLQLKILQNETESRKKSERGKEKKKRKEESEENISFFSKDVVEFIFSRKDPTINEKSLLFSIHHDLKKKGVKITHKRLKEIYREDYSEEEEYLLTCKTCKKWRSVDKSLYEKRNEPGKRNFFCNQLECVSCKTKDIYQDLKEEDLEENLNSLSFNNRKRKRNIEEENSNNRKRKKEEEKYLVEEILRKNSEGKYEVKWFGYRKTTFLDYNNLPQEFKMKAKKF